MENRLKQINKEINGATVVWQRFFEKKIKELAGGIDMNNIFVACQDENCLYSINEKGSIIWKIDAEGSIKKIKTSIEGKVLVFISNDTSLWCVDRAGIVLWKVKLGEIIDVCISGSGNVVACSFFDENKKPKLALFSKSGYSLWQKNVENIIEKISMSFDGGAIICSSGKKVEQYTKVGERTWSSTLPSNVKQIAVASSGLLIYVLADALYSISPAGKERWKISIPGGSISSVAISSDGFVNVGYTGREGNRVFRYDVRGELLWKHLSPEDVDIIRMAYKSNHIVFAKRNEILYWDKFGYDLLSISLSDDYAIDSENFLVSHDGRYIAYSTQNFALTLFDCGKHLARHLIESSKIFMDELNRLGGDAPEAIENLQWAEESLRDGNIDYALIYGYQTYSTLEATLDSIPTRKTSVSKEEHTKSLSAYKKAVEYAWRDGEPSGKELGLLEIMRDAFSITPEEHLSVREAMSKEEEVTPSLTESKFEAFDMDSYVANLLAKHIKKEKEG